MLTLKPGDFRLAYKPIQFRLPSQKTRQSIPIPETSHFRPEDKKQVNFDPYIKNN